ncbi:MAG: CHAD domain-containing protein, partial [Acidobacteriota bacterium]|nr:CHAD domain-containing protein [Acidobacteriota bacterium]
LAVKQARYLTEDLALAGRGGLEREIEGKKRIQDALGRWNDLRLFRRHLVATRDEAEHRGTVTFALELDRLIAALDPAVLSVRSQALGVVRGTSPVVTARRKFSSTTAPAPRM